MTEKQSAFFLTGCRLAGHLFDPPGGGTGVQIHTYPKRLEPLDAGKIFQVNGLQVSQQVFTVLQVVDVAPDLPAFLGVRKDHGDHAGLGETLPAGL